MTSRLQKQSDNSPVSSTSISSPTDAITVNARPSEGRPENATYTKIEFDWIKFGLLVIELVGITCLIQRFEIESSAFFELMLLATAGFVVQYFLPFRFRITLFLWLSLASIGLVFGLVQGTCLVVIGMGLIGIAHLPMPMTWRVFLLILAGLMLAALRLGWMPAPWSSAIWPILSAMFMFRLIVYMYDLKHHQAPALWSQRLSYFFMLPNVCFPLFPVVDSRTFQRSHYNEERHTIYQRGIEWMLRGLIQLILYRIVYQRFAIDPYDVVNVADLVHYFVWLFSLYLRVSGQFHVIVGMLLLFGFNLPETHHLYYFASSFTDFWRRINIYWKDFMMKVFYYPIFFRVRKLGATPALVISTMCVFALTWALHAYQLFWIRGEYAFTWNDILFWTILCGLVTINAMWEARYGRRRVLANTALNWSDRATLVLKTLATFIVICTLWSFWSSESLSFWLSLWPAAVVPPTSAQLRAWVTVAGIGLLALGCFLAWRELVGERLSSHFRARAAIVLVELALLNVVSVSAVYSRMGSLGDVVATARFAGLNQADLELLERGYYEDLLGVNQFNGELAALYMKQPLDWQKSLWDLGLVQPALGLQYELRPDCEASFKGASLRTNRWGMHDQDYQQTKPPECLRIALLGASHVMGTGVERNRTFDAVLERRLNSQENSDTTYQHIEVLNFAVYGYNPIEQIRLLEDKILNFEPDVVMYVGHPGDTGRVVQHLALSTQADINVEHEFLADIVQKAGVSREMPVRLIRRKLQPFGDEILSWAYRRLVAVCTKRGIRAVFVLLPMVPESAAFAGDTREVVIARDAGFAVVDLSDVYEGHDRHQLWIAEWDAHPNVLGHKLIADGLYESLIQSEGPNLFDR